MAIESLDLAISGEVETFLKGATASIVIKGERRDAISGETLAVFDPGTGRRLTDVAAGNADDIDLAVRDAQRAYEEDWRFAPPVARERLLIRLAELIEENVDELAMLETLDNGKPLTESLYLDLSYAAQLYRYYGGWATKLHGDVLPVSPAAGTAMAYTRHEPFGVVGAIVPWNFPMLLTAFKVGPALAAGNCVVVKPAEQTPLTAIRLAELALEAGFPPGVLNVVTGFGYTAGAALTTHPGIGTVSFTGSTETGRRIVTASAGNLIPVHLELGGKSPNIVFDDADLDDAVLGAFTAIFLNQGQVCCAGSRLYVQRGVYDQVVNRLAEQASKIKLGHGLAEGTEMGPLVSDLQLDRVAGFVERGRAEGAEIVCGGERATDVSEGGYFFRPTVVAPTSDTQEIACEEIFGPVVVAMPFDDESDVIARANASQYGLAAGVWTRDVSRAHRVAASLEAGTVWVNAYNMLDPVMPFGGFKQSGFGRDLGAEALLQYTRTKSVWVQLD